MEISVKQKLIPSLQKTFWIVGWFILALTVVNIAVQAFQYFNPITSELITLPKQHFSFLHSMQLLFSGIAQAFFAFLVSAVFGMAFKTSPIQKQQTEAFLILTCLGFCAEGFIGLASWIKMIIDILPHFDYSSFFGALSLTGYLLSIFGNLISFVYAITIYILYKHFSKMVSFEEEVI